MIKPKTWLSAIVRPDAVYIQAYIFSTGYGYISSKSLTLRNITTNEVIQYQLLEETNGTCLFKNNQKINPAVNSSFILQLSLNVFSYETNSIEVFNNVVEIKTPIAWNSLPTTLFDINISNEVVPGKTTIEPKITVIINGGVIPNNSILKICGSNAFANTIDYNSYDAAKEFILDGTQYVFSNTFKLGVSGLWNFKAFLKLPNNTITGSIIISHVVNQGDIYVNEIVETDNLVKLETSERFNLNQLVGEKRVGICTINDAQTLQKGSFYEFHNNSGQRYFDFKESLKRTIYRLPTIVELEAYYAIKSNLVGVQPISYYSSDMYEGTNNIKGVNFNSGAPSTLTAGDANAGYLLLEDFENNISVAEPLGVPVFKSNLMVQPSGYKITDFAKNVDLLNLLYSITLESVYTQPITNFGIESKYYNYNDKKIYTAYLVGEELQWSNPQTPIANTLYNYNGVSYMWNGYDLQVIAINPFVFNKADVFSNRIETIADLDTATKTGFYNIYLNEVYAPLGFGESTESPVSLIVSELVDSDNSYQIALYWDKVFKLKFRSISSGSVGPAPNYGWNECITSDNLNGTNRLMIYGVGTPEENAAELLTAYETAKAMPRYLGIPSVGATVYAKQTLFNGVNNYYKVVSESVIIPVDFNNILDDIEIITEAEAKSTRTTIIVAPGKYTFGTTKFAVNAEGIDIVSLTGNPDVMLDGINVTANDIFLKGLNTGENAFELAIGLPLIRIDNCIGGAASFGSSFSGTIKHSKGGAGSFGSSGGMDGFIYYCTFGDTGPLATGNGHIAWCINADGSAATNQ